MIYQTDSIIKYKLKDTVQLYNTVDELLYNICWWTRSMTSILDEYSKQEISGYHTMTYVEQRRLLERFQNSDQYKHWQKLFKEKPNVIQYSNNWFEIPVDKVEVIQVEYVLGGEKVIDHKL